MSVKTTAVNPASRTNAILALNAGSSSLKFALFPAAEPLRRTLSGKCERIGAAGAQLSVTGPGGQTQTSALDAPDHAACVAPLLALLAQYARDATICAIGHRIVHGGPRHSAPGRVSADMLAALREISPFDPEHMPAEIGLIEACALHFPDVPQIACFDTAFHHNMPRVASLLPLPRKYDALGVRRYGFHGLSYACLMEALARVAGPQTAAGRVVLAHLGNGASMAAVNGGACVDTTMGFTPAAGLPMGTRSGDLDPGLVAYFARTEGMTPDQFHEMVNKRSGLLGVSESSADVRDLLAREGTDTRAAEALALFCYQAKKTIAALAAALGGLDTLVFSGGIGENAPLLRARICADLQFLGIDLDAARNAAPDAADGIISQSGRPVTVRMMRTDEELQIARQTLALL